MKEQSGVAIVVDDDPAVLRSMQALLDSSGIAVRCHSDGPSLLAADLPEGPACVLLDLRMPGVCGIEIQRALRDRDPDLPVIFLSGDADVASAVTVLKDGAMDLLEKGSFKPEELLARVTTALNEHGQRLARNRQQTAIQGRIASLSRREREVAVLAAWGRANKAIAQELGISERTVEIHRGNAMRKLGLRSVTDLARLADDLDPT